jgi:hypothetical protein
MVFTAAVSAKNAENDRTNDPGMCLQQVRMWCGINARYPDAATAWRNTNDRHPGKKNAPRGSAVFWTGGSKGYGHIALSLGNGKVRSTDAGGRGRVATVDIDWVARNWGQHYAGWSWDINEVTIPHPKESAAEAPAKSRTNVLNAIKDIDKAIAANKGDKAFVKVLQKHKADLEKLAKT